MSGVATPADGITTDVASTADAETEIVPTVPEVTVDVVVAALAPTTADTDTDTEPWSVVDPVFWDTVTEKGAPLLRYPVDMVLHRGPHKRTITVFDAVIDDGHGRHR
jgi:hypothetical protein